MALADEQCIPCRGGVPPLAADAIQTYSAEVAGWSVVESHHLFRHFDFPDFLAALAFVNRIGAVAEEQGHHPDIFLAWGKVEVTIWTHKINGLTPSDFILASKIEREFAAQ
jgi:4a-hydroxytetrahydrobiopterin dehydratase